jgi:hypothetical protein
MFRVLSHLYSGAGPTGPSVPERVFATHPLQLSRWLEQMWAGGGIATWPLFQTLPAVQSSSEVVRRLQTPNGLLTDGLQSGIRDQAADPPDFIPRPPDALGVGTPLIWDHLIYAYLVESTGILPIFSEVVRRYVVGETLDAPSPRTLAWVRATEELFFRDPPLFAIGGLTSQLRPDAEVNRRNAYWRLFGWDLPHPGPGGEAARWKRDAGATVNARFVELWTELLRQVWMGIENDRNAVGANPTDPSYVAYLAQTLGEMLRMRKRNGMLVREEFAYVTMLSWFHLTVESDTTVVTDLQAIAGANGNPADRLAAIGARVGIAPPRQARELFELADLMSFVLWFIELDQFSTPATAALLYQNVATNRVAQDMNRVVDLWQSATGAHVKVPVVGLQAGPRAGTMPPVSPQPMRMPVPTGPAQAPATFRTPPPAVAPTPTNGHVTTPRA